MKNKIVSLLVGCLVGGCLIGVGKIFLSIIPFAIGLFIYSYLVCDEIGGSCTTRTRTYSKPTSNTFEEYQFWKAVNRK